MGSADVTTHVLMANGIRLHCAEAGPESGPLVLLLHGFPEHWWGWRKQIPALAEAGFRVVAPDQRGYNLSDKPQGVRLYALDALAADVVALVRACGRERCHLVGHDWGGLVAWWVATRHPGTVERLVIMNAPHPSILGAYARSHLSQALRSAYVGFFQLPWLPERLLAASDFASLRRALRSSSLKGTFPDEDLSVYARAWSQPGALTAMLDWYRALRHRPRVSAPGVAAPTLLLWGEQDQALERGLAEASLRVCENGRGVYFPHATHWLHLEIPEDVNGALTDFLRSQG